VSGRDDIVAMARGWLGTPYQHQASLKHVGCDCLGLLRGIWREVKGDEPEIAPPYAPEWAECRDPLGLDPEPLMAAAGRHLLPVAGAMMQPGDVLLFRWRAHLPAKHLAILSAPGNMIHAHDGACVAEVALSGWWLRHLAAVFRFPEIAP
jgi:NlpC/P60 family putative phage cell wall peptidase